MSSKYIKSCPPAIRIHTAPDPPVPRSPSEIQCFQDGTLSRPSSPRVKSRRLVRGPSPVKSTSSLPATEKFTMSLTCPNFPSLPSLNGGTKLRKFSRRATSDNLSAFCRSKDAVEFDRLELLANPVSSNATDLEPIKTDDDDDNHFLDNWRNIKATGRRFSLGSSKSIDTLSNQTKSAFLDFFRRGVSSPGTVRSRKILFDNLTTSKPATAPDISFSSAPKKSSVSHAATPMQPRSPIYSNSGHPDSLPEIERIIRLSQKRKETGTAINQSASTGVKNLARRVRSMKIDK